MIRHPGISTVERAVRVPADGAQLAGDLVAHGESTRRRFRIQA